MVFDSNNQQHYSMITATKDLEETLQEFGRSGNTSKKIIAKMNSQLFCAIHTLKTDESKEVLLRFYNFQAKLENNDESKIFHSLHQILDPELVKEIAEVTRLERRNIALGGFSQGGHIALQAVYGHVGFMKQLEWSCIRNIVTRWKH